MTGVQFSPRPDLEFFEPWEFREWWGRMSPKTLLVLDRYRREWGAPVMVSPHKDALGRFLGDSDSQHNFEKLGEVRAVDTFPEGMRTPVDFARAYRCAIRAGASGIGIYTDTRPAPMIHLDTRPHRTPQDPATWSRINGKYLGIAEVMPEGWTP